MKAELENSRGQRAANSLYVRASDKTPQPAHRPPPRTPSKQSRSLGTPTPERPWLSPSRQPPSGPWGPCVASPHVTRPDTRLPGLPGLSLLSPQEGVAPTPPPHRPGGPTKARTPALQRSSPLGQVGQARPPTVSHCPWRRPWDPLPSPHCRPPLFLGSCRPRGIHRLGRSGSWRRPTAQTPRPEPPRAATLCGKGVGGGDHKAHGWGTDSGPGLRSLSQTPREAGLPTHPPPHGVSCPWVQPDPGTGGTSPTHWDQRTAPGLRSKIKDHNVTCSLRGAHTPPPRAHALG